MPYDASLDEQLFSESWNGQGTKITISVYSYNKGARKLQITRENHTNEGEYRFTKLGRLTREEAEGILPLIQEALSKM